MIWEDGRKTHWEVGEPQVHQVMEHEAQMKKCFNVTTES